ncbi:MAG: hydrogenase formation protein HypD [Chloroflexota bacterium]
MRFVDEFQDPHLARSLVHAIADASTRAVSFMEFCGGHTHAILRHGIRDLLPKTITLSSGPGCPVCVTAPGDIDRAAGLALEPGVITATYGDLIRVPGSTASLQHVRARGGDVRVVYSALDALQLAVENPASLVFLPGIGFETTAPTLAATLLEAERRGLNNLRVFSLLKLTAPVMRALLSSGETRIDGIICPGHVSVITGTQPYEFIPREFGVACAVSGFEPLDILGAVRALTLQVEQQHPCVENSYPRAVKPEGNPVALAAMNEVFEPCAAQWRGIGTVPESGLRLRPRFSSFDATPLLQDACSDDTEPTGCRCGDILRGVVAPVDCAHFGSACTPEHPIGPCMVSAEGSCAAYYAYTLHG